jgi:voltage-gated potassium channel
MVAAPMPNVLQSELGRRGRSAFALGASVLLASTLSFYTLGSIAGMNARYGKRLLSLDDDRWSVSECLYAAAVTVTTVGYTDILGTDRLELWRDAAGRYRWVSLTDPHEDPGFDEASAELFRDWGPVTRATSAVQAILGIAFFLYVIAQVTSFFVEGAYEQLRTARRTRRRLGELSDHVILCGAGVSGRHVVEALGDAGVRCAVIDHDEATVQEVREARPEAPVLHADATEEESLTAAGVARARGLITSLGEDGMNVVVAVTARQLRPGLRVVSRGFGAVSARRLAAAGCSVVTSGRLAAIRVASEMVRPTAVEFLDLVLRPRAPGGLRLEDVLVGAVFAGRSVGETDSVGVVPLALRRASRPPIVYNPDDDERLAEGDQLTVIGTPVQLSALHALLGSATVELGEGPPNVDALEVPLATTAHAPDAAQPPADHFVVCGAGETGTWVVRELYATRRPFVLVESNPETIAALQREMPGLVAVEGDVGDPQTLRGAGVERARGLAATLRSDHTNLLAVVTALQARPQLRSVSLAWDDASERRLRRAGVRVVSKGRIAGRRMAAEMLRPELTSFLERMLVDPRGVRVGSVRVVAGAPAAGKSLGDVDLRLATGLRPVAVMPPGGAEFIFDPESHVLLEPESRLVVLGAPEELCRVAELVGSFE